MRTTIPRSRCNRSLINCAFSYPRPSAPRPSHSRRKYWLWSARKTFMRMRLPSMRIRSRRSTRRLHSLTRRLTRLRSRRLSSARIQQRVNIGTLKMTIRASISVWRRIFPSVTLNLPLIKPWLTLTWRRKTKGRLLSQLRLKTVSLLTRQRWKVRKRRRCLMRRRSA